MSSAPEDAAIAVIGIGNSWRNDDAAGLIVSRSLAAELPEGVRLLEHEGEPTGLLDLWEKVDAAVLVDAVRGAGAPGSVHRFDASDGVLPAAFAAGSTHSFSLSAAIELARALARIPRRLVVVAIEGKDFEAGAELTSDVAAAVESAADAVLAEVDELLGSTDGGRSVRATSEPRQPR
jgi:hydrogenase maturation protease